MNQSEKVRGGWSKVGKQGPDASDFTAATGAGRSKILPLEALEEVCAGHKSIGQRIVLCHGVFDLLHVGHIRHFRAAKKYGDILVVTITADEYVNKGPDRPAFPAELRTEFLGNLELIDYVSVVDDPGAIPAIRAVKPDFYAKGGEYTNAGDDITGKIVVEREAVEKFGGELVFTHDITFSSSNLLNTRFGGLDKEAQAYIDEYRDSDLGKRIDGFLEKIAGMKIVIVGETIIDHYTYVAPMGKAAKENIIATLHQNEEMFAGGVIAAANNLSAFCPNVELVTIFGDPHAGENYEDFVRERLDPAVQLSAVYRPDGPTVKKQRFVEPTYVRKLFEVYQMEDRPLPPEVQQGFEQQLRKRIREADLTIVVDFGHGLIAPSTVDLLQSEARFLAVNAQSNAGNIGCNLINKYSRADFICIDATEARLAVQDKHANLADVVARRLGATVDCPNIVVTHGRSGCFASTGPGRAAHIPAFSGNVVDTVGAGDAFFVAAAPIIAAGADCHTAAFVGNVAGAISIGIVGHRRFLNKLEVQRYISTLLK